MFIVWIHLIKINFASIIIYWICRKFVEFLWLLLVIAFSYFNLVHAMSTDRKFLKDDYQQYSVCGAINNLIRFVDHQATPIYAANFWGKMWAKYFRIIIIKYFSSCLRSALKLWNRTAKILFIHKLYFYMYSWILKFIIYIVVQWWKTETVHNFPN